MKSKFVFKFIAAIITVSFIVCSLAPAISAVLSSDFVALYAATNKSDFKYVALGASNVNGYGVHGYNFEGVYEAPFEKESVNRYGYKMDNPGAYPVLIKEKLAENYNVDLSLIAMSSMRVEEIRVLLDDSYWGDSYTDTWFYDTNGDGISANWSYGAALYEWQLRADDGMSGYDHTPTKEEALKTLRDATVNSVTEADLITIDVGMNNFGTYMINLLAGGLFTNDLKLIDPEIDKYYDEVRKYILEIIKKELASEAIHEALIGQFADTFAYALVGYCSNMDTVIGRIYELNPDVEIVVISIQNMMRDLDIVFPGYEGTIPFGDIFGLVVNAANLYTAVVSPYSDNYYYANVSTDGHTEFLIDEIASYNGNPSTIGENIKDCFDVYDDNMFLKTRIQQKFAVLMSQKGLINIHESQKDEKSMESLKAFHYGFHYDINKYDQPIITMSDGTPMKDFLKKGEEGKLEGDDKLVYETYENMLTVAYDVASEIMREAAFSDSMNLPVIFASAGLGISVNDIVFDVIDSALEEASQNPKYSFDIYKRYPNGVFDSMAAEYGISEGVLDTLFCLAIRMQFAGTAFCHPNSNGYKEITDIVWSSYTKKIKGDDVIADQVGICYKPDTDSYYVAIGNGEAGYAKLFASSMGLAEGQFGSMNWDDIDYAQIDKADLVSIGFGEGEVLGFAVDQILAYVGDYVSNDVRYEFIDYMSSVVDEIPILSFFNFKNIASNKVNETIDGVLEGELFAGRTMTELDWNQLVGEDVVHDTDALRTQLKKTVIDVIGTEKYTASIDVVEWLAMNADSLGEQGTELLKNTEFMYNLLGEKAIFSIDIPIADGIVYAMESYLYSYVSHVKKTDELISYINNNNPDAKIVIFGQFNPMKGACIELGNNELNLGEMFENVTRYSALGELLRYRVSDNSTFVHIFDAKSVYDVALENGESDSDLLSLLLLYTKDEGIFEASPGSDKYIAGQMRCYVAYNWDNHKYSGICDVNCNRCGEIRTVDHRYNECGDVSCSICGLAREAVAHLYDDCDDPVCNSCGYKREPVPHVYDGCEDAKCNSCAHERTITAHTYDGCEDIACNVCKNERSALSHSYDNCADTVCGVCGNKRSELSHIYDGCDDVSCNVCGEQREALSHILDGCEDTGCDICGAVLEAKGHDFGKWTETKPADVDVEGEKSRECTACGYAETQKIPAVVVEDDNDVSGGLAAIIAVGCVIAASAAGFCIYWFIIRKKK